MKDAGTEADIKEIDPGVRFTSVGIHGAFARASGLESLHISYSPRDGLILEKGDDNEKKARTMLMTVALEIAAIALRGKRDEVIYLEERIHKTLSDLYEMKPDGEIKNE